MKMILAVTALFVSTLGSVVALAASAQTVYTIPRPATWVWEDTIYGAANVKGTFEMVGADLDHGGFVTYNLETGAKIGTINVVAPTSVNVKQPFSVQFVDEAGAPKMVVLKAGDLQVVDLTTGLLSPAVTYLAPPAVYADQGQMPELVGVRRMNGDLYALLSQESVVDMAQNSDDMTMDFMVYLVNLRTGDVVSRMAYPAQKLLLPVWDNQFGWDEAKADVNWLRNDPAGKFITSTSLRTGKTTTIYTAPVDEPLVSAKEVPGAGLSSAYVNDKVVAVIQSATTIEAIETATGKVLLQTPAAPIQFVNFYQSKNSAALGLQLDFGPSKQEKTNIYDLKTGQTVASIPNVIVTVSAFDQPGKSSALVYCVSGYGTPSLNLLPIEPNAQVTQIEDLNAASVSCEPTGPFVTPDGAYLVNAEKDTHWPPVEPEIGGNLRVLKLNR